MEISNQVGQVRDQTQLTIEIFAYPWYSSQKLNYETCLDVHQYLNESKECKKTFSLSSFLLVLLVLILLVLVLVLVVVVLLLVVVVVQGGYLGI